MAYIKTLKDNELIGGQDNTDIYPVTTTQAIFSQKPDGTVPEGRKQLLEERLEEDERNTEVLIARQDTAEEAIRETNQIVSSLDQKYTIKYQRLEERLEDNEEDTKNLTIRQNTVEQEMGESLQKVSSFDKKYHNITEELYSMVRSLQVGGIALSGKFGDRTDIGIHQKSLTKAIGKIWDEIGKLTGKDYMNFSLTVQPAFIPSEGAGTVRVTADCSEAISNFDDIKIYLNDELKAASEEIEVFDTNLSITEAGINTIKAVGSILGKIITKEATVEKAEGFFMGSGQVYTDVIVLECAKTIEGSLEGDYDITVKNDGEYIFIIIPISRKEEFRRVKLDMNGFEIPIEITEMTDYIVCKSLNTYKAGTYNIDIDINS